MATAFDIRNPEFVAHELQEANARLAREEEAPAWMAHMIRDLAQDLAATTADELGFAPDDWIGMQAAALRAQNVLLADYDDRELRRQLRLIIEELRYRLTRLAEHQTVGDDRPIKEIAAWFDKLVSVPRAEKAAAFGVSERTWQRWASETERGEPIGVQAQALRLTARLVNELRHTLTAPGALRWATAGLADIGGRSPVEVFTDRELDPVDIRRVFELVGAARSGAAA